MTQAFLESDEMNLRKPDPQDTAESLLCKEGLFFLKDVLPVLDLDMPQLKKKIKALEREGENLYAVMGVRKVWNHWLVRMTVFSEWLKTNYRPKWRKIPPEWDGNFLLKQRDVFLLSHATKLLPVSLHQVRHQAKQNPRSKEEMGVWKDSKEGLYLVDMARFSQWFIELWKATE